jgi:hypothetical protein
MGTAGSYVAQLAALKSSPSQFSFNIVGPTPFAPPAGCSYDGPAGAPRLVSALTPFGMAQDICDPNWESAWEPFDRPPKGRQSHFYLTATPDLMAGRSLIVSEDGVTIAPITSGGAVVWTYSPNENAVIFEPMFVPMPGTGLTITYETSCGP